MDALTWFKSVFQRARPTPDPLRADLATAPWADAPLHVVAARLRPSASPADDDEDWDAVIARAKMQAASPRAVRSLPPPPRNVSPEMMATPPPSPARRAPRATVPERANATLDVLLRGGLKKPGAPLPAFAARRPAEEDRATPPPLGKPRRVARP